MLMLNSADGAKYGILVIF